MADGLVKVERISQIPTAADDRTITPALSANMTTALSSIQWWNTFWQVAGVALVALTFIAGLGAVLTGRWLNQEQGQQLLKLETKLGEQRERTAKAEIALEKLRERQGPRPFLLRKFVESLQGKVTFNVEILYEPNDLEAQVLASLISLGVGEAKAEVGASSWPAILASPIPPPTPPPAILNRNDFPENVKELLVKNFMDSAPIARAGVTGFPGPDSGVFVGSNKLEPSLDPATPYGALVEALKSAGLPPGQATDSELSDTTLRIIVGPKP